MKFLTKTSIVFNYYVITRYDPIADEWMERASMSRQRDLFSCSVFNRMLYVLGGCNDREVPLALVEKYNPLTNQWTPIKPMLTPRRGPGIC